MNEYKNNQITEFSTRYWMLFVFISLIYGVVVFRLWDKSPDIILIVDGLKFSNVAIQKLLTDNWEVILAAIGLYTTALAFWKFKKGVFSDSEVKVKFWSGIMLHRLFSLALLTPYVIYLCNKTLPSEYLGLGIVLYFVSNILVSSLIEIRSDHRKAMLGRRWIIWILLFVIAMATWASYAFKGFWEVAVVLFVSCVAFPASNALLKSYAISISSYDAIEKVHLLQKEFNKNVKDGTLVKRFQEFLFGEDGKTVENPVSLPFAFEVLEVLGNMCLIAAFGFVYIGWSYDLNLITTGYVHVTLVLCALHLWLIANKFPMKVDIQIDGKWRKGVYLSERNENQVIILDKKGRSIFNRDDVLEIRSK